MKSFILTLFLALAVSLGFAATPILNATQKTAWAWAKKTPSDAEQSVQALGQFIRRVSEDEYTKVLTIYFWLTQNLSYDYDSYKAYQQELPMADQSPQSILKSRRAVCAGYSQLFQAIAMEVGLQCKVITGYAKGAGYAPGMKFDAINHAWNAVYIYGKWELMDATWGDCLESNGFPQLFYFCASPRQLIVSHFPAEPKWQLLPKPWTLSAFEARPQIHSPFFDLALESYAPQSAILQPIGDSFEVKLKHGLPESLRCSATFIADGKQMGQYMAPTAKITDYGLKLDFQLPMIESGYLHIFVGKEDGPQACVLTYKVIAVQAPEISLVQ